MRVPIYKVSCYQSMTATMHLPHPNNIFFFHPLSEIHMLDIIESLPCWMRALPNQFDRDAFFQPSKSHIAINARQNLAVDIVCQWQFAYFPTRQYYFVQSQTPRRLYPT